MRLIFYFLCFHAASSAEFDNLLASDLPTLIKTVEKIFEYFNSNVKLMDVNVMFGVFIAKVNLLSATNDGVWIPPAQDEQLKRIIHYCNVLLYYFQVAEDMDNKRKHSITASSLYNLNSATEWADTLRIYAYTSNKVAELLSSSPLEHEAENKETNAKETTPRGEHMDSHVQKIGRQRERKALLTSNQVEQDIMSKWKIYKNAVRSYEKHNPNPRSSNACLRSLALSPYPPQSFSNCTITKSCTDTILSGTNFGYSLTHRLILVMTALFSRYCYVVSPESDTQLMDSLCERAYTKETASIFTYLHLEKPPYMLRDLFMEQITLCSLIGHVHFLQRPWIQRIMSWQTRSGCFNSNNELDSNNMLKCEKHMTSVALGSLTAGIRFIAEFYYEDNVSRNHTKGLVPPLIESEELTMKKF